MANKALQELQSLSDMSSQGQQQAQNLARLEESRKPPERRMPAGGEAEFAAPEALATAVAAGFVFGPVGGLLLGLAQGVLGKQAKQTLLDESAAVQNTLNASGEIFGGEIERAMLAAQSPEDVEYLSGLQTQFLLGQEMGVSGIPELEDKGLAMLTEAMTGLNAYTATNEEQRLASEALEAQIVRENDRETYDRHRGLLGDFDTRMGDFETTIKTADNIIEAVNNGDGASLTAALATLPLLVNPQAGATTEGEVELWQKIGGWADSMAARVAKELGSGGMTDTTRKEILNVTHQYKRNAISSAQAVEADFGQRLVAEKIPTQLWPQYNRTGKLPVVQQGGFVRGEELPRVQDIQETAGSVVDSATEFSTGIIDRASMAINDKIDEVKHERAWRKEFFRIHGRYPTAADNGGSL